MAYPDYIDASIELQAEAEANRKVGHLFESSRIDNWLSNNRGGTYTRIHLELKLAAQRMFTYEYLVKFQRDRIRRIEDQRNSLAPEIGKLKAGLHIWQLKDEFLQQSLKNQNFSWRVVWRQFSQALIRMLILSWGFLFPLFELILKSGLAFIVIISLLGITGILSRDGNISQASSNQSNLLLIIATIFSGVSLIHFLSNYVYYDFLFYKKDIGQSGRGFFRRLVRHRFYKKPLPPSLGILEKIRKKFFGTQLISGRTVKVLDFQVTQREIFLTFIFLAESLLGYEGLIRLYKGTSSDGTFITVELWDHLAIALSSGIYALVNIAFSIAKAKRSVVMLSKQEQYLALVEKKKSLLIVIQESYEQILHLDQEYNRYKDEYENLLKEAGGILAQVDLLSIDAYENAKGTIR